MKITIGGGMPGPNGSYSRSVQLFKGGSLQLLEFTSQSGKSIDKKSTEIGNINVVKLDKLQKIIDGLKPVGKITAKPICADAPQYHYFVFSSQGKRMKIWESHCGEDFYPSDKENIKEIAALVQVMKAILTIASL